MGEAGRPTDLTKELLSKIKKCIFDGKSLKDTAEICGIVESTLYGWSSDNYLKLADKIEGWRRDSKLLQADKNIDSILKLPTNDKDFVKTVSDMSKFVKKTLDKEHYSERSELTGKDGADISTKIEVNDSRAKEITKEFEDKMREEFLSDEQEVKKS